MNYQDALGIEYRSTKVLTRDGKAARSVSGSRVYKTNSDDLWDALTNPERLPRWFLPISGDLHVGGRYQLKGHAGGTITRCDPGSALDATWESGDNVSWITLRLESKENGTQLTLEHVMLQDEDGEAHWKQYGPGATGVGWELSFHALDLYLANGGVAIDEKDYTAWTTSTAGKKFVYESANGWAEAHIASGESEDIANEMSNKTAKFYTGE